MDQYQDMSRRTLVCTFVILSTFVLPAWQVRAQGNDPADQIGVEKAVPVHLRDGEEFRTPLPQLIEFGKGLFTARWTSQDGQGRPLTKGTGDPLSDMSSPLVFPRNFNRISGPDTGACSNCHNLPTTGGGGDFAGNITLLGDRFDFVTFSVDDTVATRGSLDERLEPTTLQSIGNTRKVVGMFGSGFIEMLAREMTRELQGRASRCAPGESCRLSAKDIDFGYLVHRPDGSWDVSRVVGLPPQSLATTGSTPPNLIIRPFRQGGNVISLRDFTNGAFNQHHGIQAEERFGLDADPDGDGVTNELTRADVTAVTLFQATLPVPGRMIPNDSRFRAAIARGERLFEQIGCGGCHTPSLPLTDGAWVFSEPGPFNPPGNLRQGEGVASVKVDLTSARLPQPRLRASHGVVQVPAYTDMKLHDITSGLPSCASHPDLINSGECDGNVEPINANQPEGSPEFFAGNSRFITRRLWGIANQHAFGHHGQYSTMREALLAHAGEASAASQAFRALVAEDQNAVIEFLKSLQILPPGTPCRVVDENYACRDLRADSGQTH